MTTPEELTARAKNFETNLEVKKVIENAWQQHEEFLKLYPFKENPSKIDELTPEKVYNPGGEYFFYWIEHGLKSLGRIFVGSAIVWENAKQRIEKLKELLKTIVNDSFSITEKIDADWDSIPRFGGERQIAKKILFCYYPKEIIPTFKSDHMMHFCKVLGIDFDKECLKEHGKSYDEISYGQEFQLFNKLILNLKNQNEVLRKWDNAFLMRFLYENFPPPEKTPEQRSREIKSLTPLGLVTEPLYEQEVIFLFSKFHKELGFPSVISIAPNRYPDAEVLNNKREVKKIEFEVFASDFNHDPNGCDYVVCWENDVSEEGARELPEIIALKDFLKSKGS